MPYIGRSTDGFGVRNRFLYLASASDTSVSGADANGATLTFTDGAYVDVYLNGVLLKAGTDYNTNTANTIAGLSALAANDEVTVIVYDVFTVGDMVSATSGGTFVGNVTFNGDISVGDDVSLASDGAVLGFGADNEITITHVADTGLRFEDSDKLLFGAGADLEIYHTAGTGSFIDESGDGVLFIRSDRVTIHKYTGETMINAAADGAVSLYYDDVKQIETSSAGIIINEVSNDVDFRVESNGNTHMLFVDGGNDIVGIGTTSPSVGAGTHQSGSKVKCHISQGDSGVPAGDNFHGYTVLAVEGTSGLDGAGINIVGDNSSITQVAFGDPEDSNVGVIYYSHSSNQMSFLTSASEQLRIASDGTLTATDTSIGSLSDQRLKTNIKDYTHDLESFKKLKPKTFDWKNPSEHGDKSGVRGFIAQDLLDADSYTVYQEPVALPEYDDKDSHTEGDGSDYDLISPNDKGERLSYASKLGGNDAMYVSVIQQLIARIEALESK